MTNPYPPYFAQSVRLGNPASGLAICTLWTPLDHALASLSPDDYAIAGNLYSREGISFMLRNILARPTITHLLICGKDLTGSGTALSALFRRSVGDNHEIIGDGTRIHCEIDRDAILELWWSVQVLSRLGLTQPQEIAALVHEAGKPPAVAWSLPRLFPYSEPTADTLPAEDAAFVVRAPTVRAAWLKLLWNVQTFGERTSTQHSSDQRELRDVITVVDQESGDPARCSYADWMPFTRAELGERTPEGYTGYLASVCEGHVVRKVGTSYTYGDRLFVGINQVRAMVEQLRASPESRRAVASLWWPEHDSESPNPPCLCLLQASVRSGELHLTAYFRSHDIYRAWAMNAYALRCLQFDIAAQLNTMLGELVIHSHSAHVYSHDWQAANEVVAAHYRPTSARLVRDPRGSFVITAEDEIAVRHYSPDGQHLQTWQGATAAELLAQVAPFVSLVSHALYLGTELQKAEMALSTGRAYVQDKVLEARNDQ